jgi:hypothetical protein
MIDDSNSMKVTCEFTLSIYSEYIDNIKYYFDTNNLNPDIIINWYKNQWNNIDSLYSYISKYPEIEYNYGKYKVTFYIKKEMIENSEFIISLITDPDDDGNYPLTIENHKLENTLVYPDSLSIVIKIDNICKN